MWSQHACQAAFPTARSKGPSGKVEWQPPAGIVPGTPPGHPGASSAIAKKKVDRSASWRYCKLSLVHTRRICGSLVHLHATDCLRCIEVAGLRPLFERLCKGRHWLKKLWEVSDVWHNIAFFFRYTTHSMNFAPDMRQQEIKQKLAFGWVKAIEVSAPPPAAESSDEEWEKTAAEVCATYNY